MTKEVQPKEVAKGVARHNTAKLLPDMRVANGLFPLPTIPGPEILPEIVTFVEEVKKGGENEK